MKGTFKNKKGVTLIALIITIVVMLILATIGIRIGINSLSSSKDSVIETNLIMVQQAIMQEEVLNRIANNEVIGEKVDDVEAVKEDDAINLSPTAIYYIIDQDDLKTIGVDIAEEQKYLVDFETGEIWDLTNRKYSDEKFAYLRGTNNNGLGNDSESYQDTTISISLKDELTFSNGHYIYKLKVIDTRYDIENNLAKELIGQDLLEIEFGEGNLLTEYSSFSISNVKVDNPNGLYEYTATIDVSTSDTTPNDKTVITTVRTGAVKDKNGFSNNTTVITTSLKKDELPWEETVGSLSWSIGTPKYETKLANRPNGYTDYNGVTWGTGATVDLTINTTASSGFSSEEFFEFEYAWANGYSRIYEPIVVKTTVGAKKAVASIYLTDRTGKGILYVRPVKDYSFGSSEKQVSVNLDNEGPKIIYSKVPGENSFTKLTIIEVSGHKTASIDNLRTKIYDYDSALYYDNSVISDSKVVTSRAVMSEEVYENSEIYDYVKNSKYGLGISKYDSVGETSSRSYLWNCYEDELDDYPVLDYIDKSQAFWANTLYFCFENGSEEGVPYKDNVGNEGETIVKTRINLDVVSPTLDSIEISDKNEGIITVKDDFSGTAAYDKILKKIKYAWIPVANVSNPINDSDLFYLTSDEVELNERNSYGTCNTLVATVEPPTSPGKYYFYAKLDNYEDVAGNVGNDEMMSSTFVEIVDDMVIDVQEVNDIAYPSNLAIKISSMSKRKIELKEIYIDVDTKKVNLNIEGNTIIPANSSGKTYTYSSHMNGPITIHIIDVNDIEHKVKFNIKKVQETILKLYVKKGVEYKLPFANRTDCDIYVKWGDGNNEYFLSNSLNANIKHTYSYTGETYLYISGIVKVWRMDSMGTLRTGTSLVDDYDELVSNFRDSIRAIEQFGIHYENKSNYSFNSWYYNCDKLSELPSENLELNRKAFSDFNSVSWTFYNCAIDSVDGSLLKYASKADTFRGVFARCKNLKNVDGNLFSNCTSAKYFSQIFKDSGLESIPNGLFAHNTNAEDFEEAFSGSAITSITSNLFANNTKAKIFSKVFFNTRITSIPKNLFNTNTNAIKFESAFENTDITSIDEDLFKNNSSMEDVSGIFSNCKYLNYDIANLKKLFNYTSKIEGFSRIFMNSPIYGTVPEEFFQTNKNAKFFNSTFYNTKISAISPNLFKAQKGVTNITKILDYTFEKTDISIIPDGVFENLYVSRYSDTFKETKIKSISKKMFGNVAASKQACDSVSGMFRWCGNLDTIEDELFEGFTELENAGYLFESCIKLGRVDYLIFKDSTKLARCYGTFAGCHLLYHVNENIFDACKNSLYELSTNYRLQDNTLLVFGIFLDCKLLGTNSGQYPKLWDKSKFSKIENDMTTWEAYHGTNTGIFNAMPQAYRENWYTKEFE